MKVVFLLNGLTHYFNSVLNRLNNSEGIEIVVIIPQKKGNNIGEGVYLTDQGVEFKTYFLKEKKKFYQKSFFSGFYKVIENEKPDMIVFIWPYILELVFNPLLLLKIKRKKIKILFKEIPFQLQSFSDAIRFKKFLLLDENLTQVKDSILKKLSNFILALIRKYYYSFIDMNLHYIEEGYDILKSYKVSREKIFVTYNSPDTDSLFEIHTKIQKEPLILPPNKYRLIHIGRLVKWKRVDLVINAISILQEKFRDIELIIIGDGPELNNLKSLSKNLQLENKINFVGAIYDPILLGKYLHCSSVYVLGGMGGLSLNEAMAFGKPIICSVCDGTEKYLLADKFNGYFFKENDINSLVKSLNDLLSSEEKIELFGRNSLSIIKNKINIDIVTQKYYQAFKHLFNN